MSTVIRVVETTDGDLQLSDRTGPWGIHTIFLSSDGTKIDRMMYDDWREGGDLHPSSIAEFVNRHRDQLKVLIPSLLI